MLDVGHLSDCLSVTMMIELSAIFLHRIDSILKKHYQNVHNLIFTLLDCHTIIMNTCISDSFGRDVCVCVCVCVENYCRCL